VGDVIAWRLVEIGPASHARFAFVGRDAELEVLAGAVARARGGSATLAIVVGPPGQGKSRLVEEAIAASGAGRVLAARCRPRAETGTDTPLRQLLESDVANATPESVRARVRELLGEDAEVDPERVAAAVLHSAGIEPDEAILALPRLEQRDVLANGWRTYLAALAGSDLLVVSIEDLHWGDLVLHRVVERLTTELEALVLVIGSARPELLASPVMRPRPNATHLELAPLDADAARRLADLAGADGRPVDRAAGNPLFIVELAQSVSEAESLPLTVQAAISARLDELSAFDRELLECASVAGETFEVRDVALLSEAGVADVAGGLARAANLGCIVPVTASSFRFHHVLVHEVAYGRLPVAERMSLHARYAREGVDPADVEARAHHWWEAVNPDEAGWVWTDAAALGSMRRDAARSQLEAGRRLAERNAYEEAPAVYERAVAVADDPESAARAEAGLGGAYARLSRGDDAWSHRLRAMELLKEVDLPVPAELYADTLEVAAWNWGYFQNLPDDAEVLRLLDEGETAARAQADPVSLARLVAQRAGWSNVLPTEDEVERIRSAPDPVRFADAAQRMATAYMWAGELDRALELDRWVFEELVPAGAIINEPEALDWYTLAAFYAGDLAEADRLADRLLQAASYRSAHTRQHAYAVKALVLLGRGEWEALAALAAELRDLVQRNPDASFCLEGAALASYESICAVLDGGSPANDLDEYMTRLVASAPLVRAAAAMLPRVMAGDTAAVPAGLEGYAPGLPLWTRVRAWDVIDLVPAISLTMLERWAELEPILRRLDDFVAGGSRLAAALAEAIREEQRAADGGPPAEHPALRALDYAGLSTLLAFRPARAVRAKPPAVESA
jgi:tetratricopeptide (TPR) repeat protein